MFCVGCFLIPGLLSHDQQVHLFSQALQQYPQPPNTSNLTSHLGRLPNLWEAAQQGLFLEQNGYEHPGRQAATASRPAQPALPSHAVASKQAPAEPEAQQSSAHGIGLSEAPSNASTLEHTEACSYQSDNSQADCPAQVSWTSSRSGPSAASLLQKLRWVALGPQFNWTTRQYELHPGVDPLPQELVSLAQSAVEACNDAQAAHSTACTEGDTASEELLHRTAGDATHQDTASCRITTLADSGLAPRLAVYHPDTALVNYYREGDTLGGHKDDAEQHDTQPIVSLSLGCDGVFLIGGHSREDSPTALLVHSGDALVLSGDARQCYHGVPRILPGQCSIQPVDSDALEVTACMQDMRVNISIRQI